MTDNDIYDFVDSHYGVEMYRIFCEEFYEDLKKQGLGDKAKIVLDSGGSDMEAFEVILNNFEPKQGFHLGFREADGSLCAIRDGYSQELDCYPEEVSEEALSPAP